MASNQWRNPLDWRLPYIVRRELLRYQPLYWGLVFPLGMYSVATAHMSDTMKLAFLSPISSLFLYLALVAWLVTAGGMVWTIATRLSRRRRLSRSHD